MSFRKRYLAPLAAFIALGGLLYWAYLDVRDRTLKEFNADQMLMARQAATSIKDFFHDYLSELNALAANPDVAAMGEKGRAALEWYFDLHRRDITAVTRLDAGGRVLASFPANPRMNGADLSGQEHVKYILERRQPVVSDVFTSVQGHLAIALHAPVFEGDDFAGTVGVLIPFDRIAEKYIENIRIGEGGYAWVMSQKGVELFCPAPGHIGKTIFETSSRFPAVIAMAREMMAGGQGEAVYEYDMVRGDSARTVKKIAAYAPAPLLNTHWSIAVATPVDQVLDHMESFTHKLMAIGLLLLLFVAVYFLFFVRAWLVLAESQRRQRAEEALRQSEERYRLVVENANEAIVVVQDGKISFFNPQALEITGVTREEYLGTPFEQFLHAEDRQWVVERYLQRLAGQPVPDNYDLRVVDKQGRTRWMTINVVSVEWEGRPATLCFLADITQRKRDEESVRRALEEARARTGEVSALLKGARLVLTYKDFAPAAREVFDVCRELLGATSGYVALLSADGAENKVLFLEAGGRACAVDPDLPMPIRGLREEAYRKGEPVWENDFPASRWQELMPPGHVVLDNVLFAPLMIEGKAQGVMGLANKPGGFDENDARLALAFAEIAAVALRNSRLLQTLEASEGRFRSLFENMTSGVAVYEAVDNGEDFLFRDLNRAGERICQAQRDQILGRSVREVFPGVVDLGLFQILQEVWLTGQPRTHSKGQYQDNRLSIWVENHVYKLPGGEIVAIFDDVTEAKRLEEERSRMEGQLRQALKMEAIGTLAGGIAHDFNNILGAVIGYGELALDAAREGRGNARDIEEIMRAGQRAKELVRQILTFGRKMEVQLQPLDLNREVARASELLSRTIPKMISIETHLAPDLKIIDANPQQIEQVLLNLGANARDAMPEGGRLVLETANVTLDQEYCAQHLEVRPGQYVLLTVSDTGVGMDEQTREHIFEPFFTTKEVGKGTGLGLSSVYGIIKGHGGHIFCYSQPGLGATFNIYLPARQADSPAMDLPPGPALELPGGDEYILLVDDEEALRDLGARTLTRAGYRVRTADSGEAALALYQDERNRPDLVILDLGMPGMGGHKCMQEILALAPRAKVIIASGYAANGKVRDSLLSGARGYVAKPFSRTDLLTTVRAVLDQEDGLSS